RSQKHAAQWCPGDSLNLATRDSSPLEHRQSRLCPSAPKPSDSDAKPLHLVLGALYRFYVRLSAWEISLSIEVKEIVRNGTDISLTIHALQETLAGSSIH